MSTGRGTPDTPTGLITSASNPVVKRVRALAERKHRKREGAFVAEGIQPVWYAVDAGAAIESLIVAPGLLRDSPAEHLVEQQESAGVRIHRLSEELFTRISDRESPSGLAAIIRRTPLRLDDLATAPDAAYVVLADVGNPGNLGTIIRTADSAGMSGVILVGETTDPYAPAAVKASMGSLFTVDVAHATSSAAFLTWAREHEITVATTSAHAPVEHWRADYPLPLALMLGSERLGLPPELRDAGDLDVRIPMDGAASSLNLAVAAGVLMYEVRARRAGLGRMMERDGQDE